MKNWLLAGILMVGFGISALTGGCGQSTVTASGNLYPGSVEKSGFVNDLPHYCTGNVVFPPRATAEALSKEFLLYFPSDLQRASIQKLPNLTNKDGSWSSAWRININPEPYNFSFSEDKGKDVVVVVWSYGVGASYFGVMNRTLNKLIRTEEFDPVTLREIPTPGVTISTKESCFVINWNAVPRNPDLSTTANEGNVIGYKVYAAPICNGGYCGSLSSLTQEVISNPGEGIITLKSNYTLPPYTQKPRETTSWVFVIELVFAGGKNLILTGAGSILLSQKSKAIKIPQ